jgi:hypothetical protein
VLIRVLPHLQNNESGGVIPQYRAGDYFRAGNSSSLLRHDARSPALSPAKAKKVNQPLR